MHRIDTTDSVDGLFSDGNEVTGVPGTLVDAAWLNAVQEEIANVVEDAGLTLNKSLNNQLASAVAAKISAHNSVTNPHSATNLATASRLALRDASGRSRFAAPSDSLDAANKGYVDGFLPQMAKAYARVEWSMGGSLSVVKQFNVASVTAQGSYFSVAFSSALADANYVVIGSIGNNAVPGVNMLYAYSRLATGFAFGALDSSNVPVDVTDPSYAFFFDFVVFG
jgi:hypothetical protein